MKNTSLNDLTILLEVAIYGNCEILTKNAKTIAFVKVFLKEIKNEIFLNMLIQCCVVKTILTTKFVKKNSH